MARLIWLLATLLIFGLAAQGQRFHPNSKTGKCSNSEYPCGDGTCIANNLMCNGPKDCDDGTDETYIVCRNFDCPPHHFRCAYGGCIDEKLTCDGQQNCADNSDESDNFCSPAKNDPTIQIGSRSRVAPSPY